MNDQSQATLEQYFFTEHPQYQGSVITDFTRNMFTGSKQAVLYDTQGDRLAIVQQHTYNTFHVFPTKD
jgi:hypothetical protein